MDGRLKRPGHHNNKSGCPHSTCSTSRSPLIHLGKAELRGRKMSDCLAALGFRRYCSSIFRPLSAKLYFKHHLSLSKLPCVLFALLAAVKSAAVGFRTPPLGLSRPQWEFLRQRSSRASRQEAGGDSFFFFLLVVGEKRKRKERERGEKTTPRGALIAISTSITLAQQRQGE